MNREDSNRPVDEASCQDATDAATRSGEGAATALKAMLRKRQQAERPELPGLETPPCPQP